jgi:homoserine O-succinyltransferase
MPTKIVTETQLLRLLSNTPLQIEVDWLCMESHNSKNTPQEHLMEFYKTFNEIKDNKYDGLIVTGAPVEKLKFEDVDYWDELTKIFDWANTNVFSSFFICWASQASLYYYYGVEKYQLKEKLTGVYHHHTNPEKMRRRILRGFDYQFYAPHSRYTSVKKEDIEKIDSLDILASSNDAGVYLVAEKDGSRFFVTGHPEYDPDTLDKEYHRDLAKGGDCVMPKNYYKNDDVNDEILVKWRSHAYLLFSNWLNYYVYQNTPYNLDDLLKMKTTNK